ncbi:MAG: nucleotidyltransferase domain-containing protein [Methanobacteriaceae archaeon]|nr:nucleotidyltransferase domain-containing protein [Methanobacteriaceae archaeon]
MNIAEVKIVSTLIEKGEEKISISQLARELKMDYKNVYTNVKKLERENILIFERFGKAINCILNKKVHPLIFFAEYKRREKLLRNRSLKILYEKLNSLSFPFIALIFGSYAKGKPTKKSDIDLMIICEKEREKEVEATISLLPLNIHPIILTPKEFLNMAKTREFTVVSEAINKNIILIGIEDYYRLIENVEQK